jgi:TrmH family RNA methyltransferase
MVHSPTLGSIHNPRVRAALALREARERRRQGLMLIDGAREIGRAIVAGVVLTEVFAADDLIAAAGAEAAATSAAIRDAGVPRVPVTAELMGRMAFGDRSDGMLAVARVPDVSLAALGPRIPAQPLVLVLESVEKPGNLGAVVRTADGAGVDALLVVDPATDPWNPNAIRASMGTLFSVPLAVCESEEARRWLSDRGIRSVAALVDVSMSYVEADLTGPVALVLGSEADGLSPMWRGADVTGVRIPMAGIADSLNVSVTAAILAYEARRQRDRRG